MNIKIIKSLYEQEIAIDRCVNSQEEARIIKRASALCLIHSFLTYMNKNR